MKIELTVYGENLSDALAAQRPLLPRLLGHAPLDWEFTQGAESFDSASFLCPADATQCAVLAVNDASDFARLHALDLEIAAHLKQHTDRALRRVPIIVVFDAWQRLTQLHDFPNCVSDWTFAPICIPDLAYRVIAQLKRQQMLSKRLHAGHLTLLADSQTISYGGKKLRLSPMEFALAELFLSQMGTVVPSADLAALFKLKGKSTEVSNIRVAIFQLRMKLEELTRAHVTLVSIYKHGYCLRQKDLSAARSDARSEEMPGRMQWLREGDTLHA